jgi:hypothetical protein
MKTNEADMFVERIVALGRSSNFCQAFCDRPDIEMVRLAVARNSDLSHMAVHIQAVGTWLFENIASLGAGQFGSLQLGLGFEYSEMFKFRLPADHVTKGEKAKLRKFLAAYRGSDEAEIQMDYAYLNVRLWWD